MERVDLTTLKRADYFRLLEYAVWKAINNEDITADDIKNELAIFPFANFIGVIIVQHEDRAPEPGTKMGVPTFRLMPHAFLAYLQYRELEDARIASAQAERHSKQAEDHARQSHRTAIAAIVISIVLTLVNIGVGLWTKNDQTLSTPDINAIPSDEFSTRE